jgi:hypothetical protein
LTFDPNVRTGSTIAIDIALATAAHAIRVVVDDDGDHDNDNRLFAHFIVRKSL